MSRRKPSPGTVTTLRVGEPAQNPFIDILKGGTDPRVLSEIIEVCPLKRGGIPVIARNLPSKG